MVMVAVGIYGMVTFRKQRTYVDALPSSRGNREIKQRHSRMLFFSVGATTLGLIYLGLLLL